jgi:zinc protease
MRQCLISALYILHEKTNLHPFSNHYMQSPNRKRSPRAKAIKNIQLPDYQLLHLDNGIPVYVVNTGKQDILKVEALFKAGRPYEKKPLAGWATTCVLSEGSTKRAAAEVAEAIDFYGGTLGNPFNLDLSNIVLYGMTKHIHELLPVFSEFIQTPAFAQSEIDLFIDNNKQRLLVELTKNEVVTYRKLTELIFGENHPYGYNSTPETFTNLRRDDLVAHHAACFTSDNCTFFVSGKVNDDVLKTLNREFGTWKAKGKPTLILPSTNPTPPQSIRIEMGNSPQTSICVGRKLFNRKHADYQEMYILNAILGGYFGSRLMSSVREDKGFTYNIYSSVDTNLHDGSLYISTEVGNDYVNDTLEQIYEEMEDLQNDLVGKSELKMVQNYLLGNVLSWVDGAFNAADLIRTMVTEEIPMSQFDNVMDTIRGVTPERLRDLAQQYFNKEDFWEVVAH